MITKTETEIRQLIEQTEELNDLIRDIGSHVILNESKLKPTVTVDQMKALYNGYTFLSNVVEVYFEEYVCGETDFYCTTFPISYLWTPDAVELDRQKKLEDRRIWEEKEKERKARLEEEKAQQKEIADRKLYEQLKKRFEGQ